MFDLELPEATKQKLHIPLPWKTATNPKENTCITCEKYPTNSYYKQCVYCHIKNRHHKLKYQVCTKCLSNPNKIAI